MPIPLGIFAVAGAGDAGGFPYEQISTTLLSASQTSVVFSSIPNSYRDLQIRMSTRTDYGSGSNGQRIRLNGDTGANYAHHTMNGGVQFAPNVAVFSNAGATWMESGFTTANNSAANIFNSSVIDILDASSSTKNKVLRNITGNFSDAINSTRVEFISGLWRNTSAITSITIFAVATNFVAGSRFTLYGRRA